MGATKEKGEYEEGWRRVESERGKDTKKGN